jgi:hypothetical protein
LPYNFVGGRDGKESSEMVVCRGEDGVCFRTAVGDFGEGHAKVIVV